MCPSKAVAPFRLVSYVNGNGIERTTLDARVPEYQVVRELGRGGMGVVFLARDIILHRLVAIKVLRHELADCQEHRERFRREARVTAQLNDQGIVSVHAFAEKRDLVYIVMEFVRGKALSSWLLALGRLDPTHVRAILASLARTLHHAHSRGVVHRDLKPDNVLLETESGRPRLTDFGVALSRTLDRHPSETARAFGTPHFMSPEQAAGETDLDGRSDIYSLGVLGYLMLTGEVPFDGDNFGAIAAKHITEEHTPVRRLQPRTPNALATAIEKCLAKEPAKRWRHAGELADSLSNNRSKWPDSVSRLRQVVSIALAAARFTPDITV